MLQTGDDPLQDYLDSTLALVMNTVWLTDTFKDTCRPGEKWPKLVELYSRTFDCASTRKIPCAFADTLMLIE
eukprot:3021944-Alexandrium_andersonii.AAC.1